MHNRMDAMLERTPSITPYNSMAQQTAASIMTIKLNSFNQNMNIIMTMTSLLQEAEHLKCLLKSKKCQWKCVNIFKMCLCNNRTVSASPISCKIFFHFPLLSVSSLWLLMAMSQSPFFSSFTWRSLIRQVL